MLKLDEPSRDQEIFIISLFSFFFNFAPWGSAYVSGSGSRRPKSFGSNGSGS